MKTKLSERSRVLNTTNYDLFVTSKEFRLSNSHLQTLMFEMSEKNLSKDLPIIIDENYNILDGKYRFEANKRLNEPIYYKVAEVGSYIDFMSAKDIQKTLSVKDYAIIHKDKIDYRLLLDGINKLPFSFKEVANRICEVDTRSRANWKDFKSGNYTFKNEYGYKLEFIKWVVDYFNETFDTTYNIKFSDAYYLAWDQDFAWVKESVIKELNDETGYISKFLKVYDIGFPISSSLNDVLSEIFQLVNHGEQMKNPEIYGGNFTNIDTLKLIDKALA